MNTNTNLTAIAIIFVILMLTGGIGHYYLGTEAQREEPGIIEQMDLGPESTTITLDDVAAVDVSAVPGGR